MTIKQITKFLEKHPKGKHFEILCKSGTLLTYAVICTKTIKGKQLIEVELKWGNVLQRRVGGWYLKLQENGVEGGIVKKCYLK